MNEELNYHKALHDYQFVEKIAEDPTRCRAQVAPFYVSSKEYFSQCSRARGQGPGAAYCAQHARKFKSKG